LHLERGIVDVSFWGTTLPKAQFQQMTLFRENFVGVARSRHPVFGQTSRRVSLRQYLAHPHAVVSLGDPGRNVIDEVLASKGHARRIAAATPSFMANLAALSGSDLIATVPYPECGYFKSPDWEFVDVIAPSDLVVASRGWKHHGATIFGGCCGIGPEHIATLNRELRT
jgi:DNA-binding transcriptional LysR family regulator